MAWDILQISKDACVVVSELADFSVGRGKSDSKRALSNILYMYNYLHVSIVGVLPRMHLGK